jgi:hypothetical protein
MTWGCLKTSWKIEGRLRSQKKLLGKLVGVMCPPFFGCRTNTELCRVRGWAKNLPSRLLGALPKRSWLKRLRFLNARCPKRGARIAVHLRRTTSSKRLRARGTLRQLGCLQ